MALTNSEYVVFLLVTVFLAPCLMLGTYGFAAALGPFGCLFWFPLVVLMLVPAAVVRLMAPVLRLLGRKPPDDWAQGPLVLTLLFWPVTAAPAHFLNFRVLGWPEWGFTLLMLASMMLITAVAVCWHSRRRWGH